MSSIPAEKANITRHDENKTRTQRPEQKESSSTTRRRTLRTPTARRLELRGRPSRKPLISSEAVDAGDTLRWARTMCGGRRRSTGRAGARQWRALVRPVVLGVPTPTPACLLALYEEAHALVLNDYSTM